MTLCMYVCVFEGKPYPWSIKLFVSKSSFASHLLLCCMLFLMAHGCHTERRRVLKMYSFNQENEYFCHCDMSSEGFEKLKC